MRIFRNLVITLALAAAVGTAALFVYFHYMGNKEKSLLNEGISLMEQGNYRKAKESFAQAQQYENQITRKLSSDCMEEDLYKYTAVCDFHLGELDEAAGIFDRLLRIHPRDPILMESRAGVYAAQGQMEEAVSLFDMAIEIDNRNYTHIYTAALTLREYGNTRDGKRYLNRLLEEHGDEIDDLTRGQALCFTGRYDEAVETLSRIENPDMQTSFLRAGALCRAGKNEEVLKILDGFEEEVSANPEMLDLRGAALCGLGSYEEGLACFEEALPLAQEKSGLQRSILSNRISALESLRRFDQAAELAQEFLELYPNDTRMKREVLFLQTR